MIKVASGAFATRCPEITQACCHQVLSMALKEVTLYPGTKDEGELSGSDSDLPLYSSVLRCPTLTWRIVIPGSIGVTYENSDVANDIRAKLSGVPFKYLRPPRKTDVQLGGVLAIERNESATGSVPAFEPPASICDFRR